jgi:hypothetical protein
MLAAMAEDDVECRGCRLGIGKEQFVKVAHAEEQQRVRVIGLRREPLRHRGRRAGG